mmetsp:Transcript_5945/g.6826  ORF Transcript_5945/g.6826 Transcript_5945/m.6826 type:complete len:126 (+) Transcript_5945:131-508(+)
MALTSSSCLRNIIVLLRDLSQGIKFYGQEGIGLRVTVASDKLAEVCTGPGNAPILLKVAERESDCSTGYTPILCFDVDDVDETVKRLMEHGGVLDGPIKYPTFGKVAAVRSPDGHMISLFENNER